MAKVAKDPSGGPVDPSADPLERVNYILRRTDVAEVGAIAGGVPGVTSKSGAVRWALACAKVCREAGVGPGELGRILAKHAEGAKP